MTLREGAKTAAKRGFRAIGFDVRRLDPRDLEARRPRLAARHGIATVFDVGANQGQWARAMRASGYRGTIVSFEPQTAAFGVLENGARRDPLWHALNLALGAQPGRRSLHVSANSWSSSLLEMEESHRAVAPESAYVGDEEVEVATLEDVCADRLDPAERIYLKMDVQGYEMEVLRGAGPTLDQVDVIELEMSIEPLYHGQVLYRETIDHLERTGFGLVGLEEGFTDPLSGRLLQFDALFERTRSNRGEEAVS